MCLSPYALNSHCRHRLKFPESVYMLRRGIRGEVETRPAFPRGVFPADKRETRTTEGRAVDDLQKIVARDAGSAVDAEIDVPFLPHFRRAREERLTRTLNWLGTVLDSPDYSYRAAMPRARAPFSHPSDDPVRTPFASCSFSSSSSSSSSRVRTHTREATRTHDLRTRARIMFGGAAENYSENFNCRLPFFPSHSFSRKAQIFRENLRREFSRETLSLERAANFSRKAEIQFSHLSSFSFDCFFSLET